MSTISKLLSAGHDCAPAISAPDRTPLCYGALRSQLERVAAALNRLGIGRNHRVAIVLSNGPEAATVFLSVAACATAAPLNPGYRAEEFEFYLSDMRAHALLVEQGSDSAALEAARKLNIALINVTRDKHASAGTFDLAPREPLAAPDTCEVAEADDTALVLHTSGTTSRPKLVPLSQRNIFSSAAHIRAALELAGHDRTINIMPLFHVHGLIAGLLSPLAAGGCVFCTPGFNGLRFFAWFEQARPTWYTAVPTMHQAILARAVKHETLVAANEMRFIRSSSSALPPRILRELEATFRVPVIEAYGMTEAAHQMASNPLPPRARKPGTVGLAAGPEVAIMDERGQQLPAGSAGEVVIRGPNVMRNYENDPRANAESFVQGWFRTGDQGVLDEDGYLTITGRLKEIINRGGEKIAPREVDEVLLEHPAIHQVVTFAMPHPQLGEDVAAAAVLRAGVTAVESELRAFAAARLAAFKVPRRIVLLKEIPKGPTGKLQRIGLAQKLGLA